MTCTCTVVKHHAMMFLRIQSLYIPPCMILYHVISSPLHNAYMYTCIRRISRSRFFSFCLPISRTQRFSMQSQKVKLYDYTGKRPKTVWGEANESEAPVAMEQYQAGHCRNCSNANLFWHKKQRYVYSSGPHTTTSYQDTEEKCKRSSMKDLLYRGSQKIFIQLPRGIPEELSDMHQCIASS